MQKLLFDETEKITSGPPEEPGAVPIGAFFRSLYDDYCTVLDGYAANLSNLLIREREDAPCVDYILAVDELSQYSVIDFKVNVARRISARLIHHASKVFAPEGTTLDIRTSEISDIFPIDRDTLQSFDPVAIWAHLETKYGQGAGTDEAWKQVAQKIIYEFDLKRNSEVKKSANHVILNHRVYIDSFDKKHDKVNRLHYNCRESLSKAMSALASFAQWAGRDLLSFDLKRTGDFYWRATSREAVVESHKKLDCGDNELLIVTFTSRFEFRFRSDVAAQLQAFLGTYGVFRD